MISGASASPDVDVYARGVKNCVERCIKEYMDVEQTMERLWHACRVPHHITSAMWRTLEETNPEFFSGYSLRLELLRQIDTFNVLLDRQAQTQFQFMNPPIPQCHDNYGLLALSLFDQNCPSTGDRQLMKFSDMVPGVGPASPQDSSFAYPWCPINGCANTRNNIGAPNDMISALNSNLPYGFSDNSFTHRNFPSPGFSSTVPGNGNMPQLPIMHGSYLLNAQTSNNTNVHSPMNTEDENGTVTQRAFGGLTRDDSPSSA